MPKKIGFAGACFLRGYIEKIGNTPNMLLTNSKQVLQCDTIIFTGGEDVNPALYKQENTHSFFNVERDKREKEIFDLALEKEKEMLGVCRGHQLINVLLGGTLYQDFISELNLSHSNLEHRLNWISGYENLERIFRTVNTMHHQAVRKIADSLTPISFARDGIIESLICKEKRILTFQFHPECLSVGEMFFNSFLNDQNFWK